MVISCQGDHHLEGRKHLVLAQCDGIIECVYKAQNEQSAGNDSVPCGWRYTATKLQRALQKSRLVINQIYYL